MLIFSMLLDKLSLWSCAKSLNFLFLLFETLRERTTPLGLERDSVPADGVPSPGLPSFLW